MEGRNKAGIFILVLVCSILIIISQNFGAQGGDVQEFLDWSTYLNASYDPVWVSFQDSLLIQVLPFLSFIAYFPTVAGVMGAISALIVLKSEDGAKIVLKITGLFAIIAFALFTLIGMMFGLFSSELQLPNMPGAYFCLVPGILILILSFMIKKPDYMKGHAREDKEYYAIGGEPQGPVIPSVRAPTVACPKCGAMISADQTFCESCGEFL